MLEDDTRNRIQLLWRRLSQKEKWPGWVLFIMAIFVRVPDIKSRIDFWSDLAVKAHGHMSVASSVITSPWFPPLLGLSGVLYVLFVGEPKSSVQRHPRWSIIGWSVVGICFTTIVAVTISGAIEAYVQKQIAIRSAPIQRHLTEGQKNLLQNNVLAKRIVVPGAVYIASSSDNESQLYTAEIYRALKEVMPSLTGIPYGYQAPGETGIIMYIIDPDKASNEASKLLEAFKASGIAISTAKWKHRDGWPPAPDFMLFVTRESPI